MLAVVLLGAGCASGAATPAAVPTSTPATAPSVPSTPPPTVATTTIPTVATTAATAATAPTVPPTATATTASTTATTAAPAVTDDVLAGITMTSVPPDVIVPTSAASLAQATNPINGRRGGSHPLPDADECATGASTPCLAAALDALGFDVTDGSGADRERRLERATAVVELDAGLPATGQPDAALLEYVAPGPTPLVRETRQIGTSAQGRPITAVRYGDGPRTVLVVGQTHGDEEGGLRVLLRARTLPVPEGVTLWVIPSMNPDGGVLDTRFLADGADPNRQAPSQPEQQAVYDFAVAMRPALTVWYHQNYGWVGGSGASMVPARRYQALTRLGTLKHSGDCAVGFMWCATDDALASSSILVELPDVLTPADVQRHAQALLTVAAEAS